MCANTNCRCHECKNELNLDKLCLKELHLKCLETQCIESCDICASSIEVAALSVENEIANDICVSGQLQANQAFINTAKVNDLCARNANLGSACINDLKVSNIESCIKWRAAVTMSASTSYALNSNVNWDVILDDPNGNISLAPFFYTVPKSGYYTMSYYVASDSLAGAGVISGVPLGLLTVTVNGSELRQFNAPYLSFTNIQHASLSALVLLNAGDIIRMKYEVLVLDPASGLVSYVGSVNIDGNGLFPSGSGFEIHYLSSLNCVSSICPECPMVTIGCEPVVTPCNPCDSHQGETPCGCFKGIKRQANADQQPCESCQ